MRHDDLENTTLYTAFASKRKTIKKEMNGFDGIWSNFFRVNRNVKMNVKK